METIRLARREEIGALTEMWTELMEMHAPLHPAFDLAPNARRQARQSLERRMGDPWTRIFVCVVDKDLAGMLISHYEAPAAFNRLSRRGYISETIVRKNYRGMGYGNKLYRVAGAWLKALGVDYIELQVAPGNIGAVAFWHARGFSGLTHHMANMLDGKEGEWGIGKRTEAKNNGTRK